VTEGDCDDADPAIHPGATEGLCDGVDSDCDGQGEGVAAVVDDVELATIAAAVAAVLDGGTVLVCPGVHGEQVRIDPERELTLTSWSGDAGDTVLDGGNGQTVVYLDSDSVVSLSHLTIRNGEGEDFSGTPSAGGVRCLAKHLEMFDCVLHDNNAGLESYGYGGALEVYGPDAVVGPRSIRIESCTFENNSALYQGGAISAHGSKDISLEIIDSVFTGNTSGYTGGAIYLQGWFGAALELTVEGTHFEANDADYGGGAISLYGSLHQVETASVSNSEFNSNHAGVDGGALTIDEVEEVIVSSSAFHGNRAEDSGGAIAHDGSDDLPVSLHISDCTFDSNSAGNDGGAIDQSSDLDTTLTIERTTFTGHDAGHSGGALSLSAHTLGTHVTAILTDADIDGCHAEYKGGAISAGGHQGTVDLILERTTITGNSTDGRGGAIGYWTLNDGFSAAITDSTFDGNLATENGGFVWCGCSSGEGITIDITNSSVINHDLGAAHLTSPLLLTSTNTDWGSGATDNVSYDIDLGSITYDAYGAGASFTCTGADGTCY
jgi:predicted outer membrane repeat protein